MYKLVDNSSFNCSILALNESGPELVRVFIECGQPRLTFLRGRANFWQLHLGIRRSGDLVDLLENDLSAIHT